MTGRDDRTVLANDFAAQWSAIRTDVIAAVDRVGASGWYVLGREVETFEARLANLFGLDHAVGVASGLDALEIALRCAGVQPAQPVLTTPLTAFATTLAILRVGAVPWFVDVTSSGQIDFERAEAVFRAHPHVRVFVPVHLYGHALPLGELARLRDRYEITIIEDCAQAIGARSHARHVGSVGRIAATSFYPTKNLGALGDGGALLSDDSAIMNKARAMRDYGQTAKYEHTEMGMNSRLDEVHAAILSTALLPRLASLTDARRRNATQLTESIHHSALAVPPAPDGSQSVFHLFPVLARGGAEPFVSHLRAHGVQAARHYPKLVPEQTALVSQPHRVVGDLTEALRFARDEVSLPVHPFLSADDITHIVKACHAFPG